MKRAGRFIRKLCRPGRDEGEHRKISDSDSDAISNSTRFASLVVVMGHLKSGCDSLIVSTKHEPLPILKGLFPFLACSCPLVLFSEHIEPLASCFDYLKTSRLAIQLQLTETWNREIKVAPKVTHPQMTMSATGGYILTGIKVNQVEVMVEKKGKHVGKGIGAIKGRKRKKQKEEGDEEGRAAKKI